MAYHQDRNHSGTNHANRNRNRWNGTNDAQSRMRRALRELRNEALRNPQPEPAAPVAIPLTVGATVTGRLKNGMPFKGIVTAIDGDMVTVDDGCGIRKATSDTLHVIAAAPAKRWNGDDISTSQKLWGSRNAS